MMPGMGGPPMHMGHPGMGPPPMGMPPPFMGMPPAPMPHGMPPAMGIGMGMGMGMGMGVGMAMPAPPPPPSGMGTGTIAALKSALGVSSAQTGSGAGTSGALPPPPGGPPGSSASGHLSVAQLKAQEKQQKEAKEAQKGNNAGLVMQAAGKRWRDPTLDEWPENDHRIFVGDMGECFGHHLGQLLVQMLACCLRCRNCCSLATTQSAGFHDHPNHTPLATCCGQAMKLLMTTWPRRSRSMRHLQRPR